MQLKYASLVISILIPFTAAVDAAPKLAYEKAGNIYLADIDGKNAKKIAAGDWPDISPDGSKIAFNTSGPLTEKLPVRSIAIADVATGKVTVLKNIPGTNSHSPHWSPDGKSLVFLTITDSQWNIGFINADDTGFRYVFKTPENGRSFWVGCWASDGKSIFCQDMENLVQLSLEGSVLKSWPIATVFSEGSASSGIAMDLSPSGKYLLIDIEMGDGEERPDWAGPAPALWKFDIEAGTAVRVTEVNHFAWQPNWLGEDEVVFTSMPKGEDKTSTYRGKIGGKDYKRVLTDVFAPSVSQ